MVDISVQTDTYISWPPAITLVFLLPYLPSWLPITATLRICPSITSSNGYQVKCSFSSARPATKTERDESLDNAITRVIFNQSEKEQDDDEERSKNIMEEILALSGDIKMVIKWINARVEKAVEDIKSLYQQ